MTSVQKRTSFDETDEKRKKRMISNRESARRSRMKKENHVRELIAEISRLQNENKAMMSKINEVMDMFVGVTTENNVLRAQISELTNKLYSLTSALSLVENEALVEPWQFTYPAQPGPFSAQPGPFAANMFNS
ncbi:bZIP transcription factor 53-like [Apium graveolens]|uniref:bZIP transcription factor 53-like n=1 Tax=Apium graveolens TaxID=4045 RepID=UPI003D7BC3D2